jgi:DNA polymerase-1
MSNLINSFINPLQERHIHKGRVHATLNQLKADLGGTVSGRFSCQHPNLQQVPKRLKEIAIPFRRIFVADPGYVFWERDYSQCEPRLFAHYSGDKALVEGYNSKPFRDAHQVVADLLKVERDPTAKRMNMGIFTGMQVKTFAEHMGWSEAQAADAWHQWYREFPGVRDFQAKAKMRLKNRGWVKTILGRRCRLEHSRFAYRGTSKIIQGSNADIIKLKLLEADRMCEDAGDIVQIHMTVHDSFNGQFQDTPEARALFERIVDHMQEVQIEPYNLRVPFMLEGEEGANWAEATFGRSAA